jgi:hypothetical protein
MELFFVVVTIKAAGAMSEIDKMITATNTSIHVKPSIFFEEFKYPHFHEKIDLRCKIARAVPVNF